jgi:hypothetical protein
VEFADQDVDDPDEEEDVQEDRPDARDLVDPVVYHVVHPTAENC